MNDARWHQQLSKKDTGHISSPSTMDVGRLSPRGNAAALKQPAPVINLLSDDEEDIKTGGDQHLSTDQSDDGEDEENGSDGSDAWDVNSMIEDALEVITDQELVHGDPEACTLEEALNFRKQLRQVGPEQFFRRTVESNTITARKLLTAFGIKPPAFLDECPDESFYALLSLAVSRELDKRMKLDEHNSIQDAVDLLKNSKNIIVITGAGISTSLGIPDFRSRDVGLYATLAELGLDDPQQVFDIELFREDPTIFYSVAKRILPETTRFSPTHAFIRLLQDKGKLLTNYSQNIDNLEAAAGVHQDRLIQCHGSFATATCQKCRTKVVGEDIFDDIKASRLPRCKSCEKAFLEARPSVKRKRSSNGVPKRKTKRWDDKEDSSEDESMYDMPEAGIMKPDITFFGESLSENFHNRLTDHDRHLVDLVVVIGTSLKVAPVSEITPFLPAHVPQIYISREPVKHIDFDIDLLGDCDVVTAELCRRAGWELKHEMIPEGQKVNVSLVDGFPSRHVFTEEKTVAVNEEED